MGWEKRRSTIKSSSIWLSMVQCIVCHYGLMGELYNRENCCIDRGQDQWGITEHRVACQVYLKSLPLVLSHVCLCSRENHVSVKQAWSQRSCLCFTGCCSVCSVIIETSRLKQSGVNAGFRLGIEMLDCKNGPKETCALCQLITSLCVVWIIDMICVFCSCMDITKSYLFQLMRFVWINNASFTLLMSLNLSLKSGAVGLS